MNLKACLPILLMLSPLAAASEPCPWPRDLDAVVAAPDNHKVLLENEHVRVLEVTVPPHSVEPLHAHCWPSTLYVQAMDDMVDRDASGRVVFEPERRSPQVGARGKQAMSLTPDGSFETRAHVAISKAC